MPVHACSEDENVVQRWHFEPFAEAPSAAPPSTGRFFTVIKDLLTEQIMLTLWELMSEFRRAPTRPGRFCCANCLKRDNSTEAAEDVM